MTVEVFYIDGCPNHKPAVERVKKVLQQERVSVELIEIEIHDETEAKKMGSLDRLRFALTVSTLTLSLAPKPRPAWRVDIIRVAFRQKI